MMRMQYLTLFVRRVVVPDARNCVVRIACNLSLLVSFFFLVGIESTHLVAQESAKRYQPINFFNINANHLNIVLKEFFDQSNSELFYSSDIVDNKSSSGVIGTYTNQQALEKILEGTSLRYEETDENIFLIYVVFDNKASMDNESIIQDSVADSAAVMWVIEEIVVTATKRSLLIQDAPMSVSVLDKNALSKRSLIGMDDYLNTIVAVDHIDRGVGRNAIIIRGLAADPAYEDATVGVYFDEVPLTGRAFFGSADLKLVDMRRVEILRGPQGTLYGASSLAGTVRNIPMEPDLAQVTGHIDAGYTEMAGEGSEGYSAAAIINIPVVPNVFAVRASAYRFNNSGYINNIAESIESTLQIATNFGSPELAVNENDVGRSHYTGARVRALWQVNEQLSLSMNYVIQDSEQDGLPESELDLGITNQSRLQQSGRFGDDEGLLDKIEIKNLVVRYDFGWAELMSSTSLLNELAQRNADLAWFFVYPVAQFSSRDSEVLVEEVRLASALEGGINFILGLYYESANWVDKARTFYDADPQYNPYKPSALIYNYYLKNSTDQHAVFGEINYDINNYLTFTIGARVFAYDQGISVVEDGLIVGMPVGTSDFQHREISETDNNKKIGVSYSPNDDLMLYSQLSEGFRLGGPQRPINLALCDIDQNGMLDGTQINVDKKGTDSDKVKSYEVGGKYSATDGRWFINGALYHSDWTSIPVSVLGNCGVAIVVNGGRAKSSGFEIESSFYLMRQLKFNSGVSFVDAEITENVASLKATAGNRLAGSARYKLNMALQYDFKLSAYDAFIHFNYTKIGAYYSTLQAMPPTLGDYALLNVKTGIQVDEVSIELYVNNINNTKSMLWVDKGFSYPLRPRMVGVDVSYQF